MWQKVYNEETSHPLKIRSYENKNAIVKGEMEKSCIEGEEYALQLLR